MATKLADETLAAIIEGVLEVEDDDFASFEIKLSPFAESEYSNADVLLVCKRWMRVGTPPLFHTCIIRSPAQAQALAKALKKSSFGAFVRRVRIEGAYGAAVKQFLEKAPNIQELVVTMPEAFKDNAKPMFSMLGKLQLRRFTLCEYNNKQNAQSQYAREAIVSMLKNCETLQELSITLPVAGALSLTTIPCTISKLSTCIFGNSAGYRIASVLLDCIPSLRSVEFLFSDNFRPGRSGSSEVPQPQEDIVATYGRRIYLRGSRDRTGITLSEFEHLKQQHKLRLSTAFRSVTGLPALEHVPSPLQTEIWTLVLRYVVRSRGAKVQYAFSLVCQRFKSIGADLRLEEVALNENEHALLSKKITSFSNQRAASPNFAARARKITVEQYDPLIRADNPAPTNLLACGLRHFSHLATAELFSVSLETMLLLGDPETRARSDKRISVYLKALRCLNVAGTRYRAFDSRPFTDWSSLSIYAPSLDNIVLVDDSQAVLTILPCLISGFLPQLKALTLGAKCNNPDNSSKLRDLLVHNGSAIEGCLVPILVVPDVLRLCPLVMVIQTYGLTEPLHDIDSWRSIFQAHTTDQARELCILSLPASLFDNDPDISTLGELPEDAPTVFTQDLFPALEEVQLKDYTWPTTPRDILESVAVTWAEQFANRGISLVDDMNRPWRSRLLTKQARARQSTNTDV